MRRWTGPRRRETAADPRARGLAVANGGLALQLADTELERGRPSTLRFRIVGRRRPARARLRRRAREAHAPDRRPPRRPGLPAPAPRRWTPTAPGPSPLTLPRGRRLPRLRRLQARRRAQTLAADLVVDGAADYEPLPAPAATATTRRRLRGRLDARRRPRRPRGRAALHGPPRRQARPDRALPRRRRPPGRAARGRPRLPARAPGRRARRRRAVHDRVPERGPLPALPAVQARRPRPHRRVHAGGGSDERTREHIELPITGMTCASCATRIERSSTSSTA